MFFQKKESQNTTESTWRNNTHYALSIGLPGQVLRQAKDSRHQLDSNSLSDSDASPDSDAGSGSDDA